MKPATPQAFTLRPHDPDGAWESNDGRYRGYAHELLAEHESLCLEVLRKWPAGAGTAIHSPDQYPEISKLARRRDQSSDTVRVYAAMAVEGYLNFYGVLRLGQQVFDDQFEPLGLVPKLRSLLLICDHLIVGRNDPIVLHLDKLAQGRNSLVHPKTIEVLGDPSKHQRSSIPMPETARYAVQNMEAFFMAFALAVPKAGPHLSRSAGA